MTDKEKTTQDTQFDISFCMEMMEKMMREHMKGCNCTEMMSRVTSQVEIPDEWLKVMFQMMDFHCTPQKATEKSSQGA